ncbi:MAG: hypothetical protein AB8H79_06695 [Myxococcota bacterium]
MTRLTILCLLLVGCAEIVPLDGDDVSASRRAQVGATVGAEDPKPVKVDDSFEVGPDCSETCDTMDVDDACDEVAENRECDSCVPGMPHSTPGKESCWMETYDVTEIGPTGEGAGIWCDCAGGNEA